MGSLFDNIREHMDKKKKALDNVGNDGMPRTPDKSRGLPEPTKLVSLSGEMKESERAVAEMRRKGWVK